MVTADLLRPIRLGHPTIGLTHDRQVLPIRLQPLQLAIRMELEISTDTSRSEEVSSIPPVTSTCAPHGLLHGDESRELRFVGGVTPPSSGRHHGVEKGKRDRRTHAFDEGAAIEVFSGQEFHVMLRRPISRHASSGRDHSLRPRE